MSSSRLAPSALARASTVVVFATNVIPSQFGQNGRGSRWFGYSASRPPERPKKTAYSRRVQDRTKINLP
ncbi:MAG: hypothetical protein COY99_03255 [Candidatus Yonathbacteria bacterium CG_4_10_14_0_8_um_filter_47_645]|uniref:Uncharacterized protein n=1 Tax=Candidatus Nomurabacteria bacterium CG1_02_47_685 TaxID=1805282 RepID=A0A1J4VCD0_9BACT|nr:MAG: hypothetical protein AUJ44_02900 [Candidatus Nomurabacteria bacterium CG1_02_47_685]PIP03974.1 MAG: hypothetical protein COX54_01615 [Candidatus Yonathbacteria bacterium CG23_combo_of_CG06-09_8_20_14_all_46_18]PIY57414.1 MAG: hypothetical protein COY99_03255 [Candidatus Yonathbacteria bacterium CG_4_10_14_0_8_um_filter_47_645]PJC67371.1 MAG: hypothetical protein CO016_01890 [Candidatus Yonathbacteria bacterium CG_4_8_14_3_um_filter_46_25]